MIRGHNVMKATGTGPKIRARPEKIVKREIVPPDDQGT